MSKHSQWLVYRKEKEDCDLWGSRIVRMRFILQYVIGPG